MKDETKAKIKTWATNLWAAIKSTPGVFIAGLVIGYIVGRIGILG